MIDALIYSLNWAHWQTGFSVNEHLVGFQFPLPVLGRLIFPEISSQLFSVFGKAAGKFVKTRKYIFRSYTYVYIYTQTTPHTFFDIVFEIKPLSLISVIWTILDEPVRIKSSIFILFWRVSWISRVVERGVYL